MFFFRLKAFGALETPIRKVKIIHNNDDDDDEVSFIFVISTNHNIEKQ
jgi:hypothetical protein